MISYKKRGKQMGGTGSGTWYRWNKKAAVEDCRALDINRMVNLGAMQSGTIQSGTWQWKDGHTGEVTSSVGYVANTLDKNDAFLRLYYTVTDTGEKFDYKIRLEATQPHYGGLRWWFVCPYGHGRTTKLFRPCGGKKYASRHAYRLSYASQSENETNRAIRRMWKLKNKIGGERYFIKPKGMHRRTHQRIYEEIDVLEYQIDRYIMQRFGGLGL
jgi:hypothetical protein